MDERLMKSLIKALGINPDEMVEGAKNFVIEIQARQKAIEDSLQRMESLLIAIRDNQHLILQSVANQND